MQKKCRTGSDGGSKRKRSWSKSSLLQLSSRSRRCWSITTRERRSPTSMPSIKTTKKSLISRRCGSVRLRRSFWHRSRQRPRLRLRFAKLHVRYLTSRSWIKPNSQRARSLKQPIKSWATKSDQNSLENTARHDKSQRSSRRSKQDAPAITRSPISTRPPTIRLTSIHSYKPNQ